MAFDDESFRAPIGTGYLHIQRGSARIEDADGESVPVYTFSAQVSDAQGRVVTEFDAADGFSGYAELAGLFTVARKAALRTDHVLDVMLGALRGK